MNTESERPSQASVEEPSPASQLVKRVLEVLAWVALGVVCWAFLTGCA